jgi:multiple sugar transport system permease protein
VNQELMISEEELRKYKIKKTLTNVGIYTFLVVFALFVILPFYWMIATSLRDSLELESTKISFFPKYWKFSNYAEAVKTAGVTIFIGLFKNTLIVGFLTTAGTMVTTVLAAFAFARLNFRGEDLVFTLFLSLMMIPNELVVITNYVTITNLEMRNTFGGLILPSVTSVFYIYLLKENFAQIPNELYYAAKVDGTTDLRYLLRVMVPICKPTLVTITILKVIECWNSYVWPRLVTDKESHFLVSNGIQSIRENGFGRENIPAMMAAVVAVSVPLIVLFLLFRNRIMEGVSRGGTKG